MEMHTSGEWKVDDEKLNEHGYLTELYISGQSGGRIGQAFGNCLVTTDDELRANAKLFAASSALLEALKYARRMVKASECDIAFIDAAIAKAQP